jgi:hypothetical protein
MPEHEPSPSADIIDLKPGITEDGALVFSHINKKWRNAAYERRKADQDTKRVEIEQAGKERL